jgi:uncharacterized membrane protein YeaQ/YmgE (transglycosylase-associated protein family)
MISILSWIVFGLIVGVLAKFLLPGKDPGGMLTTIAIGIAGALVGGWLTGVFGYNRTGEGAGWIMSILGAILLLLLYRAVKGNPAR